MLQGKIVNRFCFFYYYYFLKYFCKVAKSKLVLNRILFNLKYRFEGIFKKEKYYVFLRNSQTVGL